MMVPKMEGVKRYLRAIKVTLSAIKHPYIRKRFNTVIVMGMHRSGTSCITRMINLCGARVGENLFENQDSNPLGHWENVKGIELNDLLLRKSGGSWYDPPAEADSSLRMRIHMKDYLSKIHKEGNITVWKDPRLSLTFPLWEPYLGNYFLVIPFRHPMEVAKSLNKRDGISIQKALYLWYFYNYNILKNSDNKVAKKFINFSLGIDHVAQRICEICESIDYLEYKEDEVRSYFRPSHVNEHSSKFGGSKYKKMYNKLLDKID